MQNKFINWIIATLKESAWAPLSVVAFYFVGLWLHLFDMYPPLDIPTHFMGGVAITFFYRSAIWNSQKIVGDIPLPIQILFAFTATGTTTVLWEFYENSSPASPTEPDWACPSCPKSSPAMADLSSVPAAKAKRGFA